MSTIRPTTHSTDGTDFYNQVIHATYNELVAVFGEPSGYGDETYYEWELELEDGTPFTIYDWKKGFSLEENSDFYIKWNIASFGPLSSEQHRLILQTINQ